MARGGNSQGRFTQQNIEASALDDFLNAQQGDESLSGGDGEDRFFGGRGDDVINGGLGFDTAIYSGDSSNYQITATADGLTITALTRRGREGSDTLSSIERLEFADGNFLFVDGKLVKEVPPAPTPEPIPEPIPEAPREPAPDTTATTPSLTVSAASGNEDTAIALNIAAALGDLDGSETLSITLSGVPQGVTLSAGTNNGNGSWTLTAAQLAGLKLTPKANSDADFTLTVTATATESNGGTQATKTVQLPVTVNAVADAPTLVTQSSSGVQDQPISINPHIVITLNDTDGSEILSVTISGLPQGASLTAGTKNADGSWTLTPQQLTGLAVNPPPGSTDDFTLTVTAITREANGSTAQTSQPLLVTVDPAPSGGGTTTPPPPTPADTTATTPSLTVSAASGNEDTAIALNIAAALGDLDGSETLSITLSGVPQGVTLSAGTNNGNGSWTLTAAQLAGLKLTPKANSDADFTLTVTATATESNGGTQATKTVQLPVTVNAIADKPTLTTSPASGNEDTAIALNIAAALGDLDGSETLSITVSGVPQGATLSAGANNGNGSWTLTVAQLSGLKITPPANYSGTINLQLTAIAKEGSGGSTATTTGSLAVNVNAVADAPTLVTQSSSGVQDQPISINPHIVITLNDTDGSETLSVTISGLPQGASLTAGTKNADGSWTLTPQQLTGLAVNPPPGSSADFTLTVTAITREANGSTAQTSQPLLVTVDEAPSGGGSTLPPPSTSGNIVGLKLQNKTGSAEESGYVTFGQTFVEGQVAANGKLVAIINGQQYAVQMDVKATWDDGSVRHATLTFKAPIVAANSSVDVMLAHGSATATGSVITPSAVLAGGLDLKVALTLHNSNGTNTNLTIDAAQVLQQAISAGKVETWMQGTQAGEYRVSTTINNSLKVIFDIRMTADGEFRTDVVFSNENTFTSGVGTVNYDVTIREGGQVVFSDTNISHYRYANWHTTVWSDAEPATFLVRDVNYLIKTGALPGYDTTIPISSSTISSWLSKLAAADTEPLGNSLILENMYAPGGRPDIGPETAWTTAFLLAQSEASWSIVEANADAAGSIPWHYIDEKTGTYVRVDNNPNVWLRSGSGGGWSADNAHAPSLTYVAYLLTGDHYYLEELQARASWAIALHDPNLYGDDTRHFDGGQIRARAWDLRDLAYAAFATPDSDPLKAYYVEQLEFVLDRFVDKYVVGGFRDAAGEIEGYLSDGNAVAPWQNDFVVIVLGQLSAMGFEQADVLMEWMSNFVVGRFINAEAGFNPLAGPGYWWDNTYNGQMIDTWAELYQVNYGSSSTPTTLLGYPDWSGGYAANAKAAIATVINTLGSADAIEAYGFIVGETAKMLGSYQSDPTWAITPQFSDGSYLSVANTKVLSSTSGGTLAGTAANELLHGNDGSDTVTGGAGIDWVYGGNGNDALSGDAGNDYLFGNFGNDRITGGTGNDYMKGGAGADTFVFASGDIGQDSISDFKPGTDRLEIKANLNGNGLSTASSILATATQDSAGNAVLHLGGDDTVTLLGVSTQQLGTSSIVIT